MPEIKRTGVVLLATSVSETSDSLAVDGSAASTPLKMKTRPLAVPAQSVPVSLLVRVTQDTVPPVSGRLPTCIQSPHLPEPVKGPNSLQLFARNVGSPPLSVVRQIHCRPAKMLPPRSARGSAMMGI